MRKIMIVDDNTDFTYVMKKRLEHNNNGYSVISAHSGTECFEILQNGVVPDIILLDVMIPDMNGWDIYAKLKEHQIWRKVPIVFLSAKTDVYSKGFGRIAACDYVEKPCDAAQLQEVIEKTLSKEGSWQL
ncbi:MAG: response regulator [Methanobacteriota archaeon]